MGRNVNRLLEQLGKVVRTHPGRLGQGGQCDLSIEISLNIFNHPTEAGSRKTIPRFYIARRSHSITTQKMNSERAEQGLSEQSAAGEASFEVCFERAKNVLHLWILNSPLGNEFHVASCAIVSQRLLQYARFKIEKDPFHRLSERDRVLGTS